MTDISITTPDSLRVIDMAHKLDTVEERLKLAETAKGVLENELHALELENEELRRINRRYRAERQRDRETAAQARLEGRTNRDIAVKTHIMAGLLGMAFAMAVLLGIIWTVGV